MAPYSHLRLMDVLIVDNDPWMRDALAMFFRVEGIRCTSAGSVEEGERRIRERNFGLIFCDYWLEGADGLAFLRRSRLLQPEAVRILVAPFMPGEVVGELNDDRSIRWLQKPIRVEPMEKLIGEELARRNPVCVSRSPRSGGAGGAGPRKTPGPRGPHPRENPLRVVSHGLVLPRKRHKRKAGGIPDGENPGPMGVEEAPRGRISRKDGGG